MSGRLTQAAIINAAAAKCGSTERITSIEDRGNMADHARAFWPVILSDMVGDHPWNFALRRAKLPRAGSDPVFGFDFAYDLPADCARFLPPRREWDRFYEDLFYQCEIEDGQVLTDFEAPLPVRYISRERFEDTSRWPGYFAAAVRGAMAAMLARPLTGSMGMMDRLEQKADMLLRNAKRRDGLESGERARPANYRRSRWLRSARGYVNPGDDPFFRGVYR